MSEWKALWLFKVLFALSAFQRGSCSEYVGDSHLDESCCVCVSSVNDSSLNECYNYGGANFGLEIKQDEYIKGVVVMALPSNACSVVVPRSNQSISGSRNVFLLIDDGGCDVDLKAYQATQAGYSAAIIRNMETDDHETMKGDKYKSKVKIPAIYVGKTAGNFLERNDYLKNTAAEVKISSCLLPPPLWELEFYMIPFAIIVGICFVLMAMFMISRYYRHYLEQRRSRLSPTSLRKIPTKKYKKGDDFYDLCAICLEEYKDGERLRILPCEHAYHCKCVDPWLTEGKRTCPVCKQPVENNRRTRGRRGRENLEAGESTNDADETTPLISSQSVQSSHSVVA